MAFVYSCCFWFSLRLGGIIIGIFSLIQASALLITCIVAQANIDSVQRSISTWINDFQVPYSKIYLETIRDDPEKFITILIALTCFYLLLCILYIYGAYTCNCALMIGFIFVELLRLLLLCVLVSSWLLVLKENTMDIGLLIGASVVSGFALLGMFYLWVCAMNLPILINEMEREEQAATISKLRQLLETKQGRGINANLDDLAVSSPTRYNTNLFRSRDVFTFSNNNFTSYEVGYETLRSDVTRLPFNGLTSRPYAEIDSTIIRR